MIMTKNKEPLELITEMIRLANNDIEFQKKIQNTNLSIAVVLKDDKKNSFALSINKGVVVFEERLLHPDFEFTYTKNLFYEMIEGIITPYIAFITRKMELTKGKVSELYKVSPILDSFPYFYNKMGGVEKSGTLKPHNTVLVRTLDGVKEGFVKILRLTALAKNKKEVPILVNKTEEGTITIGDVFDCIAEGVLIQDLQGRVIGANKSNERQMGYELKELLGKLPTKLIVEEDLPLYTTSVKNCLITGSVQNIECTALTKNKNKFPLLINMTLMRNIRNEPEAIITVFRDITEQKKVEEEINKTNKQLETLYHITSASISSNNKDELLQLIADKCKELSGAMAVSINSYDKSTKTLRIEALSKLGVPLIKKAVDTLKVSTKKSWKADSKEFNQFLTGKKPIFIKNLHVALFKSVNKKLCDLIQKKTGLQTFLMVPILIDDEVKGAFAYFLKEEENDMSDISLYENLANQTSQLIKKAEISEQIRESEERYRNTIELAPESIITSDLKGTITSCNSSFLQRTGFSREEIVGKHFTKLPTLQARDIPKYAKLVTSVLRGKIPKPFEFRWVHKDGTDRFGEAHFGLLKKRGKLIGAQAILIDITKRKKFEEALRESEKKYRNLAEQLTEGILIAQDNPFGFVFANSAISEITGYSNEELLSFSQEDLAKLIHSEDQEIFFKRFNSRLQGEKVSQHSEFRCIRKDGSIRWLAMSCDQLDYGGKPAAIATFMDITEKKKAEEKLKAEKIKLENYIEGMVDAVVVMDSKGTVLHVNNGWQKLTGYKKEEIIGKSVLKVAKMLTGEIPKILANFKNVIKHGGIKNTEIVISTKDKKEVPILVNATLLKRAKGKSKNVIVVARDITEMKKAKEAIKKTEEHYSDILAMTNDVAVTLDAKGYIKSISRGIKNVPDSGYTAEELVGKHYTKIVPKKELPRLLKLLAKAWLNPGCYDNQPITGYLKGKDGTLIATEGKAITHKQNGKVTGVTVLLRDVRQRKKAEETLRESEEKYRTLTESSQDAVFMTDYNRKYLFINSAGAAYLGKKPVDFIGRSVEDFFPKEVLEKFAEHGKRIFEQKIPQAFEFTSEFGGKTRTFSVVLSPVFKAKKEVTAILGVGRDITESKKAEEMLDKVNLCLLSFGSNLSQNTQKIVETAGSVLGGIGALYNREKDNLLCTKEGWNIPEGFKREDDKKGHLCYDVITKYNEEPFVVNNLNETPYAKSDPNVTKYKLKTYVGCAVKVKGKVIGSLCVVYQKNKDFTPSEKKILSILAQALGVEEERKKAERALQERKELLQRIFDNIPIMVALYDDAGRIKFINEELEKKMGWSLEEWQSKNLLEKCYPNPECRKEVLDFMISPVSEWKNFKTKIKEGSEIDTSWFNVRLSDGSCIGIGQDVTERKKAEEKLKRSSWILKNMAEGVMLTDEDNVIYYTNFAFDDMFGYERGELAGKHVSVLNNYTEKESKEIIRRVNKQIDKLGSWQGEFKNLKKDGTPFTTYVRVSSLDERGKKYFICVQRDITESKKAEEALRSSEATYREIFNSANDAIMIHDINTGEILDCNDKIMEFSGYTKKELMELGVAGFSPKEDAYSPEKIIEVITKAAAGEPQVFDWAFIDKWGKFHPTIVNLKRVSLRDEAYLLAVVRDVTEQKKAEKDKKILSEKVAKLTKEIPLTKYEKDVLHGVVKYASLNDQQLAERLNLRRSTVTAIRNKLKKQNFYSPCVIPNFSLLGCELMCVLNGEVIADKSQLIENPEVVFAMGTGKEFFSIVVSGRFSGVKKLVDEITTQHEETQSKVPYVQYFPFDMSQIARFFKWNHLLADIFELDITIQDNKDGSKSNRLKKSVNKSPVENHLSRNEKIVLYALTKFPGFTDTEIARKTFLSRVTVSKARKSLLEGNFFRMINLPNKEKLGLELIALSHGKRNSKSALAPSTIFDISTERVSCAISLYANYTKYKNELERVGEQSHLPPKTLLIPIKELTFEKLDFASLLKHIFELDDVDC